MKNIKKRSKLIDESAMVSFLYGEIEYTGETKAHTFEQAQNSIETYGGYKLKGKIQTKNLSSDNRVEVHFCCVVPFSQLGNTEEWYIVKANFEKNLEDDFELWHFETPTFIVERKTGDTKITPPTFKLAVNYQANGLNYWDNNNTAMGYHNVYYPISLGNMYMRWYQEKTIEQDKIRYHNKVFLKSEAFNSTYQQIDDNKVFIRYSCDNWTNSQLLEPSKENTMANNNAIKLHFDFPEELKEEEKLFSIHYLLVDTEYIDDNFGEYYKIGLDSLTAN